MTQGEVITYRLSDYDVQKKYYNDGLLDNKLREKGFITSMDISKELSGEWWIFRQFRATGPIKSAEDHIGENVERGD